MKSVDIKYLKFSGLLMFIIIFMYPVYPINVNSIISYSYGFPFPFWSIHQSTDRGKMFFRSCFFGGNTGTIVNIMSLITNIVFIYNLLSIIVRLRNQFYKK